MSFPNLPFWSHLLALAGLEVCCLAALGWVAQFFLRPALWQRTAWQVTIICLLLAPASEWTGFGRGAAGHLFGQKSVVESAAPLFIPNPIPSEFAASTVTLPAAALAPEVWWPAWVWLAGTALVLGRVAAAQILVLMLRLRREKIACGPLPGRVQRLAARLRLRRKVSLLRMPRAISPMAFGLLRPIIGLPPGFEEKLTATEQDAVLAHELAHLAALDPLWFLLADLACALLWWHPLVWWTRRSLHGAAELAADEATALVPDGPGALAACLVSLGQEMTAARAWGWIGINGGFQSKLGKRVERLMRMTSGEKSALAGGLGVAARMAVTMLVVPVIVLFFGAFQSARAQKKDTWNGQLRNSWNDSPGALLALAALEDKQTARASAATVAHSNPPATALMVLPDLQSNQVKSEPLVTKVFHVSPVVFVQRLKALYGRDSNSDKSTSDAGTEADDGARRTRDAHDALGGPRFHSQGYRAARRTNEAVMLDQMLTQYLTANGVDLTPPKSIFFNDRLDTLQVHATALDLEIIQQAIQMLNWTPPQVMVETKFVELMPEQRPSAIIFPMSKRSSSTDDHGIMSVGSNYVQQAIEMLNWTHPQAMIETKIVERKPEQEPAAIIFPTSKSGISMDAHGVMSVGLIPDLRRPGTLAPETMPNTNSSEAIASSTTVGVLSPAELRAVINAIEQTTDEDILSAPRVTTESGRQFHAGAMKGGDGVTVDAIATVGPDGFTMEIAAFPRSKHGQQAWQASASITLFDGDTMVVSGEITNQPHGARKMGLVFITPRIIDPAGNRVHTDEEIARQSSLPAQGPAKSGH